MLCHVTAAFVLRFQIHANVTIISRYVNASVVLQSKAAATACKTDKPDVPGWQPKMRAAHGCDWPALRHECSFLGIQ